MGWKDIKVEKREDFFLSKTATKIWQEVPSPDNPYLAENCHCHGYDLLDLAKKRSFVEVFYLLFSGELPTKEQTDLLETLMVSLINPGPRHPATRASMNAAVSRTSPAHLLPISLSVLSGAHLGAAEVMAAMRFFNKTITSSPEKVVKKLCGKAKPPDSGDWHIAPGFGSRFGGIDPMPRKVASVLNDLSGCGKTIKWGNDFAKDLNNYNLGWLSTGLAAAVFCDLGFSSRSGAGLFQLLCAPGILAHGLEMADKPLSSMPFLSEGQYVIDKNAKNRKK